MFLNFQTNFCTFFLFLQGFNGRGRGRGFSAFHGAPARPRPNLRPINRTLPPAPRPLNYNNNNNLPYRNVRPASHQSALPSLRKVIPPPFDGSQSQPAQTAPIMKSQDAPSQPSRVGVKLPTSAPLLPSQMTRSVKLTDELNKIEPAKGQRQPIVYDEDTFNDDPKTDTKKIQSNPKTEPNITNGRHTTLDNSRPKAPIVVPQLVPTNINVIPTKSSVQKRLEISRQSSTENKTQNSVSEVPPRTVRNYFLFCLLLFVYYFFFRFQQSKKLTSLPTWWNDTRLSNFNKLEYYCTKKECPPPDYNYFKIKDGKLMKYQCQVTVSLHTVSSDYQ